MSLVRYKKSGGPSLLLVILGIVFLAGAVAIGGSGKFASAKQDAPTRPVTICKVVVDNGKGASDEGGKFDFSVDPQGPNSGNTQTEKNVEVHEGDAADAHCFSKSIGSTVSFQVTEDAPKGWIDADGYPKYFTGTGNCPTDGALLKDGSFDKDVSKVTICNKAGVPTGNIQVHKYIWDPQGAGGKGDWKPNKQGKDPGLDFLFYLDNDTGNTFEDIVQGNGNGAGQDASLGDHHVHEVTPPPGGYTFFAFFNADNNGTECKNVNKGAPSGPDDPNYQNSPNDVKVTVEKGNTTHVCAYNAKGEQPPETREVQVCKLVVDNGVDPAKEGGEFHGVLDPSSGDNQNWSATTHETEQADCDTLTIAKDATFTLTEVQPGGWSNSADGGGYPKYFTGVGNGCPSDGSLLKDGSFGADVTKVTICNKAAPPQAHTRDITVCKEVVDNGDKTNNDGDFAGSIHPDDYPSVAWSEDGVTEGHAASCHTYKIGSDTRDNDVDHFSVSEDSQPNGWKDASGYPKFFTGTGSCDNAQEMTQGSTGSLRTVLVGKVTICNKAKETEDTGSIQVHKYLPKDNGNPAWQNQGAAAGPWHFTVYDEDPTGNPSANVVGEGDQLDIIGPLPQTELWIVETDDNGDTFFGWFLPDGDEDSGNDKCNQQDADGSSLESSAILHLPASIWESKGNVKGVFHICAYNKEKAPDVSITKTADDTSIDAGTAAGFVIEIKNDGDADATNVTLSDQLPTGGGSLTWTVDAGGTTLTGCTINGSQKLTCSSQTIAKGTSKHVHVVSSETTVDDCGTLDNVASYELGTEPSVDSEQASVEVLCGHIVFRKIIDNYDPATGEFSGTFSGPTDGIFTGLVGNGVDTDPQDVLPGSYTAAEDDPGADYEYVSQGGCATELAGLRGDFGLQRALSASLNLETQPPYDIAAGETVTICIHNVALGHITIRKFDETTGHSSWGYSVTGPETVGDQTVDGGSADPGNIKTFDVPIGADPYFVTEHGDANLVQECEQPNSDPDLWIMEQLTGAAGLAVTTPGATAEFQFHNVSCGLVEDSGTLVVHKVLDINGNGVKDGTDSYVTWGVTIKGPSYLSGSHFTMTGGTRVFSVTAGTYTVTEDGGGVNYVRVGVESTQAALTGDNHTDVVVTFGVTDTVTFYNQPLVSVTVQKRAFDADGNTVVPEGWEFTITGCGIASQTKTTPGNGRVVFSGLPAAVGCAYTVVETTKTGWTVVGGASQQAAPDTAGENATLTFVNNQNETPPPPPPNPPPSFPNPTPTPTNTPVPGQPTNTPTPTNTPKHEPTPINTVEGARTPGAVGVETPAPPSAGTGTAGSTQGVAAAALAGLGLMFLATGMFSFRTARRRMY